MERRVRPRQRSRGPTGRSAVIYPKSRASPLAPVTGEDDTCSANTMPVLGAFASEEYGLAITRKPLCRSPINRPRPHRLPRAHLVSVVFTILSSSLAHHTPITRPSSPIVYISTHPNPRSANHPPPSSDSPTPATGLVWQPRQCGSPAGGGTGRSEKKGACQRARG